MKQSDRLFTLDKKRLSQRSQYRDSMIARANKSKSRSNKCQIYFPPMHYRFGENTDISVGHSWLYNGFVLSTDDRVIAVDPGVDFLFRLTKAEFDVAAVDTIFISHAHIDHYGGASPLIDWLMRANKQLEIIAPRNVFDEAISPFHSGKNKPGDWTPKNNPVEIEELVSKVRGSTYSTAKVLEPIKLHHSTDCYGFNVILRSGKVISYLSDTGYAKTIRVNDSDIPIAKVSEPTFSKVITSHHKDIIHNLSKTNLMIVNIDGFAYGKNSSTHLSVLDVVDIASRCPVLDAIVLAHINPSGELPFKSWGNEIAHYVRTETGKKVHIMDEKGLSLKI